MGTLSGSLGELSHAGDLYTGSSVVDSAVEGWAPREATDPGPCTRRTLTTS